MSRSGYTDCDDGDMLAMGRWRAQVASATRGKRGQAFFRDLIEALDAMPVKRLISGKLREAGEVCAIGAIGAKRGINLEALQAGDGDYETDNHEALAAQLNVAYQLVQEVEHENDGWAWGSTETPERRWERMRAWAAEQLKSPKEGP